MKDLVALAGCFLIAGIVLLIIYFVLINAPY
jgi:hypothetical protein